MRSLFYSLVLLVCVGTGLRAQTASYTTFGAGCRGSNNQVPTLGNSGVPALGRSFSVSLANARASTAAGFITGFSNTVWGPVTLPFDLRVLSAPGCALLVAWGNMAPVATSGTGTATLTATVPNDSVLSGIQFHQQWFVIDNGANALNMAWSNGGTGRIGT